MSKTSYAVKNRWNAKAYDNISVRLPKGSGEEVKALAESRGMSQAQLIRMALLAYCTEEERTKLVALAKEPQNTKNGYVSAFSGGGGVSSPKKES